MQFINAVASDEEIEVDEELIEVID